MRKDSARLRLAHATVLAHRAVAKTTRGIMRAQRRRIESLEQLARAYLAEADAESNQQAADGLRRHAQFAEKFVSLTNKELEALERELDRTKLEAAVAEARSRGESPTVQHVQRAAHRPRT